MPSWRRSTYSGGEGNCVEAGSRHDGVVLVRDTKQAARRDRVTLNVTAAAWRMFTDAVKNPWSQPPRSGQSRGNDRLPASNSGDRKLPPR